MSRGGIGGDGDEGSNSSDVTGTPGKGSVFSGARGSIVTARGTGDGLILRLDGRVSEIQLLEALAKFVESRQSFLEGNSISLEWIGGDPEQSLIEVVTNKLESSFNVSVSEMAPERESGKVMRLADRVETESTRQPNLGLFGGIEGLEMGDDLDDGDRVGGFADSDGTSAINVSSWDDPDARIIYRTLRSGQKIETEHSLVVIGDVNSGAELVAGGDILVLGSLRGVAHAGAYDETGGGRFIVAADLQPTQLRIGSIISRGSGETRSRAMEIARVDGNLIIVEPFNARTVTGLKR